MNIPNDIEFFEPGKEGEKKPGKLYRNEDGKDYIEYEGDWGDAFKRNKVLYAIDKISEEKYTLVNCFFRKSNGGTYRFIINELYNGDFVDTVIIDNCIETEARMTGLTNWINQTRIKPVLTGRAENKIIVKDSFNVIIDINENLKLEICEFCRYNFSRNESVLKNHSWIKFISGTAISRLAMHKNATAFLQLLSLFTDELPRLTDLTFNFSNSAEVKLLSIQKQNEPDENTALLSYNQLEEYWPSMIKVFYAQRSHFVRVMDLLIASSKNNTPEISFLNITTAFEVFHKYFLEENNEVFRKEIFNELKTEGLVKTDHRKWDQILRYWHLFRLTEGIDFFKQNFQNPKKTISLIRDSRNFYTHYSEPTNEIWTPNRLIFANKALRQLLKAVLLQQLKLPDVLINQLLNNRAATFYQDYEKNEYSIHYRESEKNNAEFEFDDTLAG